MNNEMHENVLRTVKVSKTYKLKNLLLIKRKHGQKHFFYFSNNARIQSTPVKQKILALMSLMNFLSHNSMKY